MMDVAEAARHGSCFALALRHEGIDAVRARELVGTLTRAILCKVSGRSVGTFVRNAHGKPALPGSPGLWFNLSHAAHASLLAISRRGEIGCDIDDRLRDDDLVRVGPMVLHPHESSCIESLTEPPARIEAFSKCWTRKEAALKARGFGFALEARSVDTALSSARPMVRFEGEVRFLIHDAPATLGVPAAVASIDADCEWLVHDLASTAAAFG